MNYEVRHMIYLKIATMTAFDICIGLKLATKFYGPFLVPKKIGAGAYKLQLLDVAQIHGVFSHHSIQEALEPISCSCSRFAASGSSWQSKVAPVLALETRAVPLLVTGNAVAGTMVKHVTRRSNMRRCQLHQVHKCFQNSSIKAIRFWFPQNNPGGQGSSSGTCNYQDLNYLNLKISEEFIATDTGETRDPFCEPEPEPEQFSRILLVLSAGLAPELPSAVGGVLCAAEEHDRHGLAGGAVACLDDDAGASRPCRCRASPRSPRCR